MTVKEENIKLSAETYFKGIIDFIKWTSTIAVAAIIWIGSNLTAIKGLTVILTIVASMCLIFSLFLAIFTVKRILDAWAHQWDYEKKHISFIRSLENAIKSGFPKGVDVENITSEEIKSIFSKGEIAENIDFKQLDGLIKEIEDIQPFKESKYFNTYVFYHLIFLVTGLSFYLIALILKFLT